MGLAYRRGVNCRVYHKGKRGDPSWITAPHADPEHRNTRSSSVRSTWKTPNHKKDEEVRGRAGALRSPWCTSVGDTEGPTPRE